MTDAGTVPRQRERAATGSGSFAIPSLDGLRAVAITVVVAYHYGHLSGGFLGVDLFFVLSGYLITRLLLAQQQRTGRFGLGWFWTRRVRRLAPAIIVLLLTVLVWVHFLDGPSLHRQTVGQARAALVYGSNWYNVLADVGYWDVSASSTPLNHLWSLAIEEQFYFVWPLVAALFLNRWRRGRVLAWLALGGAVASMVITPVVYAGFGANAAYLGTETRVGAILLGAALALFAHRTSVARRIPGPAAKVALAVAAATGAAWFGYACVTASVQSAALYRGGLAASSLAELALVAAVALYPGGALDRVLGLSPLVALGRRSYSLYLWHYPIYALVSPQWTTLTGHSLLAWRIALTAAATEASYRLVETPIRRASFSGRRLVVAALVPALAVLAVSFVALPNRPPPANVVPGAFAGAVPAAAANLRIMVAGDSWAERTAHGLRSLAPPRPGQIFDVAKGGCGIADPVRETGDSPSPSANCLAWHTEWASTISQQHPDAIILNVGVWDQLPQQFDRDGSFVGPCDKGFQSHYRAQLDVALNILTAQRTPVFMTNVRDNEGPKRDQSDCMNELLDAAATRFATKGVFLLDLRQRLCGNEHVCPDRLHGKRVYDETGHLEISTQADINAWELQAILAHVRPAQLLTGQRQTAVPQISLAVLALDADLRRALTQAAPAFPRGTASSPDPGPDAAEELPAALHGTEQTIDSVVTHGRIRINSAAGSGKIIGRVYAYRYYTDAEPDAIAANVERYLLANHHARAHVTSHNQKTFTINGPNGPETVGFIRAPHIIAVVHLTAVLPGQQQAADSYLTALLPLLGG
ncbi:MAG: hypothetical protein QOF87_880 [Pseudonocardiales bacterium]|nr:hypothetical protein [Pseudonocardiales bacterium]